MSSFFIYVLSSNVTGIQSCEIAREKFLADYKSINFTDWFIDGKRENLIQVEDPIELLQSNDTSPDWIELKSLLLSVTQMTFFSIPIRDIL